MRAENTSHRLFRQDRRITINTIRATFAGWHDRLIAAVMLLAGLAAIRSWFVERPWVTAAWVACGAAVVLGVSAARLVAARLAFHGLDGLLAADALHLSTRRRYTAAWHGIGLAVLTLITLVARPSLLICTVAGYLAGMLAARLIDGVTMPGPVARTARPGWIIRAWLNHPGAGVAAAALLLLSLLPARALGTSALIVVVGVETLLLAAALTVVDDGTVRFMALTGHGSRHIVVRHGRAVALFAAVAAAGCWFALGPVAAGIVAAAASALALLMVLRILVYRLHGKRVADVLVSILAGLLVLVTYAMPVALPFVAIAVVWHLHRRGAAKTWLLT